MIIFFFMVLGGFNDNIIRSFYIGLSIATHMLVIQLSFFLLWNGLENVVYKEIINIKNKKVSELFQSTNWTI